MCIRDSIRTGLNEIIALRTQKGLNMDNEKEPITTTIAETENYLAWRADEPDNESTYHLELNNVTLHFFKEEWQEFLDLIETIVDEEL